MDVIDKRVCNALIPEATANARVIGMVSSVAGSEVLQHQLEDTFARYRKDWAGLWVGGTAFLTPDALVYRQNALNKLVHSDDYSLQLPLRAVAEVRLRKAFFTNIIEIDTPYGRFCLRCYGAGKFADAIRVQAARAAGT